MSENIIEIFLNFSRNTFFSIINAIIMINWSKYKPAADGYKVISIPS